MSDDTNLDLTTAEQLMLDAKSDADRALALKHHANGVRNLIQSGLSDPFVRAVEGILKRELSKLGGDEWAHFNYVKDQLEQLRLKAQSQYEVYGAALDRMEETLQGVGARLGKLEDGQATIVARVSDLDTRHGDQWRQIMERLDADEQRLDAKRARIEQLEADVAELKAWIAGQPTPAESRELIQLLKDLARERDGDA